MPPRVGSAPQNRRRLLGVVEVARGKVRRVGWTAVTRGAYAASGEPGLADRLQAWSLLLPDTAVFTHLTAAELRGWWMPARVSRPVFAAVAERERHPQRPGLQVTRLVGKPDVERVQGVRLATAAETLLACARDLGVLDLVPLADSALRLGHCTRDELAEAAAKRGRGGPALRAVLPLLDPRSESAWESILRVLHQRSGTEVVPQHEIRDARGTFVARADLGWSAPDASTSTTGRCTATRRPTGTTSTATGGCSRRTGSAAATPRTRCSGAAAALSPPRTPPSGGTGTRAGSWLGARWSRPPSTGPKVGAGGPTVVGRETLTSGLRNGVFGVWAQRSSQAQRATVPVTPRTVSPPTQTSSPSRSTCTRPCRRRTVPWVAM